MNIRHLWLSQKTKITVASASVLYLITTALLFGLRIEHWLDNRHLQFMFFLQQ